MSSTIRTLHPQYYIDKDFYLRERERIRMTTWQFSGHCSQLKEPGDYFCTTIADENLICIMGEDKHIRTFYNVCQHRAHQLLSDSGQVRFITCPYHSWTYTLDGHFKSAPNIKTIPTSERQSIRLREVRTEIFCGFIFVNLDDNAKPMEEWFPNVEAELRSYVPHIDSLKPLLWVDVFEKCNWKVSVENYSECYHCVINHPTFAKGVIKPETYDIQPQGYCLRHTTECQNLEKMTYPIDFDANANAGKYSSWFLWPLFSFQVYPGNILNTYHWRPNGTEGVTVWRGWYANETMDESIIYQLAKQDRETTVEEDISLVESVQQGLGSRGYQPGPLVLDPKGGVNSEHSVYQIHQWVRKAMD